MAARNPLKSIFFIPLPDKYLSSDGGRVASVDISMTIQTGPGIHPVRRGRSLKSFKPGVRGVGMTGHIVAIPADLRHPAGQEFAVVAAVWGMAIQAVLLHRRMGPHVRTPLLGVALVTEFIHGICFELGGAKASVLFVTTRAFQFSFADGMMGGPVLLGPYALVAEIAEVWLGGLQILPGTGMNGVAVVAGNPLILMLGHVPKGQVLLLAMTGKAFGGFGLGVGDSLAEDEDAHASLTALFHVGCARTMAGFAPFFVFRASGDGFFGMGRNHVGLEAVLMAPFADFRSHGAVASARLLRRQASPEDEKNGDDGKDEIGFPHHIPLLLQVK
jgi:hypothetical protein